MVDALAIESKFRFLLFTIKQLEASHMAVPFAIQLIDRVHSKLVYLSTTLPGAVNLIEKFDAIMGRNSGYNILKGIFVDKDQTSAGMYTGTEINALQNAYLHSMDSERSFNAFKWYLRNDKRRFTFDNLQKFVSIKMLLKEVKCQILIDFYLFFPHSLFFVFI